MKEILITTLIFVFALTQVFADNLLTATEKGSSTTSSADIYIDVAAATLNVTDVNKVMVVTTFTVETAGEENRSRNATFRIADATHSGINSTEIIRRLENAKGGDKGIGSLVYIFDVSSYSGTIEYKLQHKTSDENNTTSGTVAVVALGTSTGHIQLDNDIKSISTGVAIPEGSTYTAVTGLTTEAITLPVTGSIFVSASINNNTSNAALETGDWIIQMKQGLNGSWQDIGSKISRSLSSPNDYGIASLGLIEVNLPRNDYYFRLAHKSDGADLFTANTNIIAVALAYNDPTNGGRAFPCFVKENISGSTTTSNSFESAIDQPGTPESLTDMLFYAKYNMTANGTLNAPSFDIYLSDGSSYNYSSQVQQRYLSKSSDVGAGASCGLAQNLISSTSYTASLRQKSDGSTSLTTYNIYLSGFQTTDQPAEGYWVGGASGNETQWNIASNWAGGSVPTSITNVTIFDKTNEPVIASNATCNTLTVVEDGSVTVNTGQTFTITDDLVVESGGSFINNGVTTVTGNTKAKRFIEKDIWHYVSSPVGGQAINATFIANNDIHSSGTGAYNFYRWDEPDNTWYIYDDDGFIDNNFVNGRGYALTTDSDRNLEFSGSFNSIGKTITVYKTEASGRQGSNLIGNPFLAPISLSDFTNEANNPNIEGTIYFWSEQGGWEYPSDNYAYWNGSGSIGAGTQAPSDQIGVAQGFMVQATGNDVNVNFNTNMQEHANPNYFKSSDISRIKLSVQYQDDYYNETLIAMLEDATLGFDRDYDGRKLLSDANLYLYTKMPEEDGFLAIQGIPFPNEESTLLPLIIKSGISGSFDLNVVSIENIGNNIDISLEDKVTDQFIDLKKVSNIEVQLNEGLTDDRFLLHFSSANGTGGLASSDNLNIYSYCGKIYVINPELEQGDIYIYNTSGQVIIKSKLNGQSRQSFLVGNDNLVLIAKVQTTKSVISKKVILN